ncbi:MAG: hypothetical protein LBR55_01145 [Bacteroidales bacterium]|jgi:NAD(P)H-hydrate repair Nnr-like enzyme with NAD(P)H-hydrate dehydratase domain|nr:hypothetical protein [Bacteroidales bacterium]
MNRPLVQSTQKPFTSHDLIGVIITNHNAEWEQLVNSYTGIRLVQEQKSAQQIGCYLGRYANRLGICKIEQ